MTRSHNKIAAFIREHIADVLDSAESGECTFERSMARDHLRMRIHKICNLLDRTGVLGVPFEFSHVGSILTEEGGDDFCDVAVISDDKGLPRILVPINTEAGKKLAQALAPALNLCMEESDRLIKAARCALADLEGIMPEYETSGERLHPGWKTIKELNEVLNGS